MREATSQAEGEEYVTVEARIRRETLAAVSARLGTQPKAVSLSDLLEVLLEGWVASAGAERVVEERLGSVSLPASRGDLWDRALLRIKHWRSERRLEHRHEVIDRKFAGRLTDSEQAELDQIEALLDEQDQFEARDIDAAHDAWLARRDELLRDIGQLVQKLQNRH